MFSVSWNIKKGFFKYYYYFTLSVFDIMELPKDRVIIAGDVNERDGIGVEIYRENKLVVEIFRDDTKKTRAITLYQKEVSLEFMEECIRIFKEEISWDFIEY